MANVHRREVLLGFVAGAVGVPLSGTPSAAAVRTEPPGDGPLSVKEVGSLLGQHKVKAVSITRPSGKLPHRINEFCERGNI